MHNTVEQSDNYEIDIIKEIIIKNRIISHYQPIISIAKQKTVGIESLARGIDLLNGTIVSPLEMFEYASNNGMIVQLDRLCRENGIETFKDIHSSNIDLHLFINIDTSVIDMVAGSNYLLNQVNKHNISPQNIVIEIKESEVQNIDHLLTFVNNYREAGFLIALDDVGAGFSNFDRISLVKPDIIKIDRSLINDIEKSYYKQEIFKCLVNLANKIGAVVVAEGVETKNELFYALEYGVHLVQGYFFSKPQFLSSEFLNSLDIKINNSALDFKNYMNSKMHRERIYRQTMDTFLSNVITELETNKPYESEDILLRLVNNNYFELDIECAYIINEQGIQVSNTVFNNTEKNHRHRFMFSPAIKGVDHSLKKYYYKLINSRVDKYISNPYVSHATGNVCITVAKFFTHFNNNYILCVDCIHTLK